MDICIDILARQHFALVYIDFQNYIFSCFVMDSEYLHLKPNAKIKNNNFNNNFTIVEKMMCKEHFA